MKLSANDQINGQMRVLVDVLAERKAQDAQWGGPTHDDAQSKTDWQNYIHRQSYAASAFAGTPEQHRERLVKIAALAFAAIESIDRKSAGGKEVEPTRYSYSTDGEMYRGDCLSVEEALAEGIENSDSETTIYVGEIDGVEHVFEGHADNVLEQTSDWLYENVGEVADSIDVPDEKSTELDALIAAWLARNVDLNCWCVVRAKEYAPDSPEFQAALQAARADSGNAA